MKHLIGALVILCANYSAAASDKSFDESSGQFSGQASERIAEFKKKMSLARAQIEALNGESNECIADGECEILDFGESRCGGASTSIIYSRNNPDVATIKKLGDDFTAAEKGFNTLSFDEVKCATHKEPDAKCIKQKCVDAVKVPKKPS